MSKQKKKHVWTVLMVVQSRSRKAVQHEIRLAADKRTVYCTCESWKWGKGRDCYHMDDNKAVLVRLVRKAA
jgi:hypothetical protein